MNDYYVYCMFRPTGQPFYIGKGRGDRLNDHGFKSGERNSHKINIIRKAAKNGQRIVRMKIAADLQEDCAYELERFLISEIGREPKGPLVNLTDGGDGLRGLYRTEAHRAAIAGALRGVQKSEQHRVKCAINASKAGHVAASMPEEWRQERYRKAFATTTPEKRSEWQKKAWETRCRNNPNALEQIRALGKTTKPEATQVAVAAAAARSPSERSEAARKGNASRTPEQRKEIARKSWVTRRARGK